VIQAWTSYLLWARSKNKLIDHMLRYGSNLFVGENDANGAVMMTSLSIRQVYANRASASRRELRS